MSETLNRKSKDSVFVKLFSDKNNRPPRELEKYQIPQNILFCAKRCDRRNTVCISREHLKAQDKRGKEDGASEVSEEV